MTAGQRPYPDTGGTRDTGKPLRTVESPFDTLAMTQALIRTSGEEPVAVPPVVPTFVPTFVPTVVLAGRELLSLLSAVDVTVLATVDSGSDAEYQARVLRPDVVVLDLRACDGGCDAVIRRIRRIGCAVLVFNTSADEAALVGAIRAGARGFVTGEVTARQLAHTIRVLAGGSALFGADVAGQLLSRLSGRPEDARQLPADLTDREREVLELVDAGHTHRAIAERLALAPKTIRNTVASINAKQRAATAE